MALEKLSMIVPNFCRMSYKVDVALDEARAAMRSILATNGTSRAPSATSPAFAILKDSLVSICCNEILFKER
jgi:hypothetical protein